MAMFQNRSTQKDVRDWFNENGLKGDSLTFDYLELYALKPPGWQILAERVGDGTQARVLLWMSSSLALPKAAKQSGQKKPVRPAPGGGGVRAREVHLSENVANYSVNQ